MPPNTPSCETDGPVGNVKVGKPGDGPEGQPGSTCLGLWRYPTNRDDLMRSPENWMECTKKKDDDIGDLWRVHDKLYDLNPFIKKHPGGSYWIEVSRGTDITESFVISHPVNFARVEKVLEKFYVKPATSPRLSPYTFKDDGFYMTVKRRAEPIFKKVGTGATWPIRLFQDSLAATFITLGILAAAWNSTALAIFSGAFLCFQTICAHNFCHQKENWRRYYFDLSLIASHEYRITHNFSHHLFTNTLLDIELQVYPTVDFVPNRPKHWTLKYHKFYSPFTYAIGFWMELVKRVTHVTRGEVPLRAENLIIFAELLVFMAVGVKPLWGFCVWVIAHTVCSCLLISTGSMAGHHHDTCFVDGDEPLTDPDFGIGQLDATKDKAETVFKNVFVTLITFGHHPLHHMFPTVDHSKLKYVREVFEQTVRDFKLDFPGVPHKEMYLTFHDQVTRNVPYKREDMKMTKNYSKKQ